MLMIKKYKLWMWRRKLKQHQGFSNETNDLINRLLAHISSDEFKSEDINEQMSFLLKIPSTIAAIEMLVQ